MKAELMPPFKISQASIKITDASGAVVAILPIMVPDPAHATSKETAIAIAKVICDAVNNGGKDGN